MSSITRCPNCQTLFQVTAEQLQMSRGWVRCGQCAEIFDAALHLLPPAPESIPTVHPAADSSQAVAEVPGVGSEAGAADRAAAPDDISFLRRPAADSFWVQRRVRLSLLVLGLLLLLALSGQIVFHERDRIAAFEPRLAPALAWLCKSLNCSVSPLRQIEPLVIDSSSFSSTGADAYRLTFTLKNTAKVVLAMPAIELALTDALDQPLLRRVLLPAELGPAPAALAAGAEWQASLAVAVSATDVNERLAGYRLLAFYP